MEQLKEDDALKSVLKKLGSKYEYRRFIGQGSFSKVYLLHHKILGENHALKIMDSHYILQTLEKGDARDIPQKIEFIKKRFFNEARAYSKIDQPNVVRIYDVDILENKNEGLDVIYIIMQFVEGRSLKNILHETAPLEMDRIFAISKDILHAMDRIHETGIIHRDLKPANIIIEKESNRAIIIDFGLARDISMAESTAVVEAEKSLGTPVYMSPDQFQLHGKIGPGVDIYAFGILLYEMLTGDVPFKGTIAQIVQGHLMAPVPNIREKNPLAPAWIQDIIKKALAKEPENRYQKAEDLLADLEKIEKDINLAKGRKENDNRDSMETGDQEIKKRKYFKYLSIALAALTAAAIIYLFISPSQKSESSRYKENVDKVKSYLAIGEYGKAEYHLIAAAKINNTAEVKELDAKIQAGKLAETLKKDFGALGVLLKSDAAVDKKIAECRKFLDKYANIAPDDVTKLLIKQVQQNITQLADKYNSDVDEYINKGELKKAVEILKLAKNQGETAKTRELENKLFTACISKSESYCNEAKPQEAEEYYLLAKEIKPGSNLQDLNKNIQLLKSMPEGVRTIYKVNKQIKQNQQNAWEADFGNGIVMVYIPPSGNLPGFWMGKTEVSVKQYLQFAGENTSHKPEWQETGSRFNVETGNDNYYRNQTADQLPIVGISWENAKTYCQWLSKKTGVTFKLPSEAQWQKAAQGTDNRKYPWGNNFPANNLANFSSLATKTIKIDANPMGASPYGLLNMAGNVEEWCDNQYVRGGSFYDNERFITCSSRRKYEPSERNNALGFRVVIGE